MDLPFLKGYPPLPLLFQGYVVIGISDRNPKKRYRQTGDKALERHLSTMRIGASRP